MVYYHLSQAYEAEFSGLTQEMPDEQGLFAIQTDIDQDHSGYLIYEKTVPVGFIIFQLSDVKDVSEFYIIPAKRKAGYGRKLAQYVFSHHPGRWQVRQIRGADTARIFWRNVIDQVTQGHYQEEAVDDPHWGRVFRQSFIIV